MIRRLFALFVISLAALAFVYFGGSQILHQLADRGQRLEQKLKRHEKSLRKIVRQVRQHAHELPQRFHSAYDELRSDWNADEGRQARSER